MLFDLRGRGRRRTVQAIYLALAVLMGGGLVFFGIGGATNGGLFDAFKGSGGVGGGSGLDGQVKVAEKRVAVAPGDAAAWALLARLRFQLAGIGPNYDQTQGAFTPKARSDLQAAQQAWNRYLALTPPHPDPNLANQMVQAFGGTGGLGDYSAAASAAEIVASARPSAAIFAQLAAYSYLAGQTRKGDLAAAKAESLAPSAQRAQLKQSLAQAKAQAASRSGAAPPGATRPVPSR